jgi:hypothetical protein
MGRESNLKSADISTATPWILAAIEEEDRKPQKQLWKGEPTAEYRRNERVQRVRLLRKYSDS